MVKANLKSIISIKNLKFFSSFLYIKPRLISNSHKIISLTKFFIRDMSTEKIQFRLHYNRQRIRWIGCSSRLSEKGYKVLVIEKANGILQMIMQNKLEFETLALDSSH